MQLRAHARAAFASYIISSMNYPFAMLFHIELAYYSDQEHQIDDGEATRTEFKFTQLLSTVWKKADDLA